jgi:hypothetical protein
MRAEVSFIDLDDGLYERRDYLVLPVGRVRLVLMDRDVLKHVAEVAGTRSAPATAELQVVQRATNSLSGTG